MTIIDWRNGLEWVPILVFFLLIFVPVIIGAFSGWRRSIFWGSGILIMYCIGWILAAFLAGNLTSNVYVYVLGLFHINVTDLPEDLIVKVGIHFARICFFVLCTLLGTLIIVLPNYYIWGKRALKIGKYAIPKEKRAELKHQAETNGVSKRILYAEYKKDSKNQNKLANGIGIGAHLAGLAILGVAFFPICTSTTELTYAATCRYTKDGSFVSNLSTFCENTNKSLSCNYIDNSYANLSCCIAFGQLVNLLDNDGNNLLFTSIQNLSIILNNIKNLIAENQKITVNTMSGIRLQFTAFSDFISTPFTGSDRTYADSISDYINEMANSTYYSNLFIQFLANQFVHANVTSDQFLIISSFLRAIKNNTTINVFENNVDLKLIDYNFDGWLWNKLKVNSKGCQLFRSVVKTLIFNSSDFQPDQLESATNLITEFFAENTDGGTSIKPISSIDDIAPLINYDKWLAINNSFQHFEEAKEMLLAANGTLEHPYIIPADMFWYVISGSTTVQKNNEFLPDERSLHWNLFPSFTSIDADYNFSLTINQNVDNVSGLNIQTDNNKRLISFSHSDTIPSFDIFDNPQIFSFNITCTDSISQLTYSATKYFEFRSFINI